ncbi:MAG: T9SS type A sorting domain-containing protein [Flavisolibacter sp.]|jgi:hypothetical protein|nr:T9SS type A sorting domain-containing protein [Flavisolibacter sp.]
MRRISTPVLCIALLFSISFQSAIAQCGSPATFTTGASYNFNTTAEGFTGDFAYSSGGSGQLQSSSVSAGTTKELVTPTFQLPAIATTIAWGFDLAGNAAITSYTVEAEYFANNSFSRVAVCSGTTLTNGTNQTFSAPIPAIISGKLFRLVFTFTISGPGSNTKTIDNFSTNAMNSQTVLPVKFGAFTARPATSGVQLNWTIDAEENTSGYQVERSADGRNYTSLATVTATGARSYAHIDTKPLAEGYYRIKAVDFDGKFGYSTVVRVKGNESAVVVKAFMSNQNQLTIQHDAAPVGSRISVTTADGRLIRNVAVANGAQQTSVDVSTAKAGLLIVRFEATNGQAETIKIVKQ